MVISTKRIPRSNTPALVRVLYGGSGKRGEPYRGKENDGEEEIGTLDDEPARDRWIDTQIESVEEREREKESKDAQALYQPVSFPVPFFSPTSSNSTGSYARREDHREADRGRKRKEHLSLLWRA